jgi:orotate phosphoribosyltransferase
LPKISAKACFAQQAITKKKCKAKIVQGNTATAAPTYTEVMVYYQKKTDEVMQFFFCNDDIERYMKGTKRRWVKSRPDGPKCLACEDWYGPLKEGDP